MMKKKSLAIISTYNNLCGNATYTQALEKEFSNFYNVKIFQIDPLLLRSNSSNDLKLGNELIKVIANNIRNYDYVNIQFELSLFGLKKTVIVKRIKKLLNSSKKTIITFHNVETKKSFFTKEFILSISRFEIKNCFSLILSTLKNNLLAKILDKTIKHSIKKNAAILVHTKRDKQSIINRYKYSKVFDHPLTFLNLKKINNCNNTSKEILKKNFKLSKNDIIIGLFGFLTPNKGYEIAIKAMKYLPENYHLFIIGSQNPLSIEPGKQINSYINKLIHLIKKDHKLSRKKIIFLSKSNHDEFIEYMSLCDINILPYLETNRSGSGIAALSLECCDKIITSQNFAFLELEKYAINCFKKFSIGNYLELANAIEFFDEDFTMSLEKYRKKYNIHTNVKLHMNIFENN
ncbi:MAG: hypothetical protein K1060chlam5_00713 [Candidatus Anoxychlamydiales bacterium]|nr:hypothetical protein [Candidatus Anoxychlamydiales bacterium]